MSQPVTDVKKVMELSYNDTIQAYTDSVDAYNSTKKHKREKVQDAFHTGERIVKLYINEYRKGKLNKDGSFNTNSKAIATQTKKSYYSVERHIKKLVEAGLMTQGKKQDGQFTLNISPNILKYFDPEPPDKSKKNTHRE